jgi:hypothetical protein
LVILGRKDPKPALLEMNLNQFKKTLKHMKYSSESTIDIASKFYRLCNKKQNIIYYSTNYGRKSKNNESSYVEFIEIGTTGDFTF